MTHQIVTKEHMEALELLAQTNLKISNAKNALFKLQEDETAYLTEREKKALARIQKALDDSDEITQKTKKNYSELRELLVYASELATFVIEAQGNFHQMLKDFEEMNELWLKDIKKQEEDIVLMRKKLLIDETFIANEKKNITSANKKITEEWKKIGVAWGEIERELTRLKAKKT